jgi:transglutaminase-like putative cysteine protease
MNQLPSRNDLYWRALVLDMYDGSTWTSHYSNQSLKRVNYATQKQVKYQYLSADEQSNWIMGLEYSVPQERYLQVYQDDSIRPSRLIKRNQPIQMLWLGQISALSEVLNPIQIEINTRYIEGLDPKAQKLAETLLNQSQHQPNQYIRNVLAWYRKNGFVYTLTPGTLGGNRIDQFLFSSRKGFCEHYASSFVMLMRYAGIPARVVTGYQGGQLAPDNQSWEVRQLDAHAWSEVWLKGKWHRYDPTAIIAPQRIDNGMQNYMNSDTRIMGDSSSAFSQRSFTIITQLRIWSDYASYQWQSKVVGYNAETQKNWFSRIGLNSSYAGVIALVIGILSISGMYVLWLYWQAHQKVNAWQRAILKFNSKLSPQFKRLPSETFSAWMLRLNQHVDISEQVYFHDVVDLYIKQMYAQKDLVRENALEQFKSLLKRCSAILKKL